MPAKPTKTASYLGITALLAVFVLMDSSCKDNAFFDGSKPITDNAWSFKDKKDNYVRIRDVSKSYDLLLNLRITTNYKYSNIFLLLHIFEPGQKKSTRRLEFKLADQKGEWLGSGSGSTFSYQIPFARDVRFAKAGVYNFQFEQNMREEPLRDVVDCGIRIQPPAH